MRYALILLCCTSLVQAQEPILPAGMLRGSPFLSPREAPLAASLDGKTLILNGNTPGQVLLLDAATGREKDVLTTGRHPLKKLHLSPDDEVLLAVNHERLFLYNLKTLQQLAACPDPNEKPYPLTLVSYAISDDGTTLVTLSRTNALDTKSFRMQLWNAVTGALLTSTDYPVPRWSDEPLLTLSPQGNRLAVFPRNVNSSPTMVSNVHLWNIETLAGQQRRFIQDKSIDIKGFRVSQVAFHPKRYELVLAVKEYFDHRRITNPPITKEEARKNTTPRVKEPHGLLMIYDLDTRRELSRWDTEIINPMSHLTFNKAGTLLAGWDMHLSQAAVWQTDNWQARLLVVNDHTRNPWPHINRVRFQNNDQVQMDVVCNGSAGRWLVDLQQPGKLTPPQLPTFSVPLAHTSEITSMAFSTDHQHVYSVDQQGLVCTWEPARELLVKSVHYTSSDKVFIVRQGGMMPTDRWSDLKPLLSTHGQYLVNNGMGPHLVLSTLATGEQRKLILGIEEKTTCT